MMMKEKTRVSAREPGRAALVWAASLALAAALVPAAALAQETEEESAAQLTALSEEEDGAASELEQAEQALEEAEEALESIEESGEYATALEAAEEGSYGFFQWLGQAGEAAVEVMDEALASGDEVPSYTELGQDGDATSLANLLAAAEGQLFIDELREADGYGATEVRVSLVARAQIHCNYNAFGGYSGHCKYYTYAECIIVGSYGTIEDRVNAWYIERNYLDSDATYSTYSDYSAVGAGHYFIMMHIDAQGLATASRSTNLLAANGSGQKSISDEVAAETMSTSEYYERVCSYLDEIGYDTIVAHEEAQEALEEAQAAYEKAYTRATTVAEVEVLESGLAFTGEEVEPEVAVYNKAGGLMEEGVGYELAYEDNVDASSSAKVTATAIGECTGEATAKFKISRLDCTGAKVVLSSYEVVWDGEDTCPDVYLKLADGTLVGQYSSTGKNNFSVLVTKSTVTDLDGVTTGTGKVKVSGNSGAYNCLLESALTATFSIVAPEDDGDDGDDETSDETSDGASEGSAGEDSASDGSGEEASSGDDGSVDDAGDAADDTQGGSGGGTSEDADAADDAGDDAADAGDAADVGDAADASDEDSGGDEDTPVAKTVKAKQTLKVTKAATKIVKASKLKKRARTVKCIKKVTGAKGKVTYKKCCVYKGGSGVATVGRKIAVNSKTGKVTLKRGLAKGTYRVVIRVKAAATSKYKAASKVVTVKIKVK